MPRVGLTGGIATGKSTVARMMVEMGAHLVDTDRIAREVVEPGAPGLLELVERFGRGILDENGSLDRRKLRDQTFGDPEARNALNGILHPRIGREVEARLRELEKDDPEGIIIIDVPLLFEAGWAERFPLTVLVYAPAGVQIERLVKRDQVNRLQAQTALKAQMPIEQKRILAKLVVDNSGSLEETRTQVESVMKLLRQYADPVSLRKISDPI